MSVVRERAGPGVEAPVVARAKAGLEGLARPEQAAADRRGLDLEHLGELVAIEVFPVEHLEQDLLLDRQRAERREQAAAVLALGEPRADARRQRRDRDLVEVERRARAPRAAPVAEQDVARDREQVGPERALAPERLAVVDAGEERL